MVVCIFWAPVCFSCIIFTCTSLESISFVEKHSNAECQKKTCHSVSFVLNSSNIFALITLPGSRVARKRREVRGVRGTPCFLDLDFSFLMIYACKHGMYVSTTIF